MAKRASSALWKTTQQAFGSRVHTSSPQLQDCRTTAEKGRYVRLGDSHKSFAKRDTGGMYVFRA